MRMPQRERLGKALRRFVVDPDDRRPRSPRRAARARGGSEARRRRGGAPPARPSREARARRPAAGRARRRRYASRSAVYAMRCAGGPIWHSPATVVECRTAAAAEDSGLDVSSSVTTILFTDIEGSTRLWEQEGERMASALAQHDARARAAVEEQPRRHRQDDGRRPVRRVRGPARRGQRDGDVPAVARRSRGHERDPDPRALRPARRRGRAARQRLLRHAGQSHRADHERGPRRPDPRVAGGRRRGRHPPARADHAARSRQRPAEGPVVAGARLPGAPSRPAGGFPGAALARGHAQQPARAAHVVHRARARARGSDPAPQGIAPAHAARHGRPRQDAAVAADRRRHARRVSGRHLVHGSRADPRSHASSPTRWPRCSPCARSRGSRSRRRCARTSSRGRRCSSSTTASRW